MSVEAFNVHAIRRSVWTGRRTHRTWIARALRVVCLLVLLLLATAITLYVRLTNPTRVRALAEGFFARVVDADVTIGDARLSLFDGLQLDNVTISNRGGGDHATAMRARRLQISYSPLALLRGRLESVQVTATEPQIYLIESVETGRWNLQELQKPSSTSMPTSAPTDAGPPPELPEVLIRGGTLYRAQVEQGKYKLLQTVRLEAQLSPQEDAYKFNLQTRSDRGAAGPTFQGRFSLGESVANSSLTNVQLAFLEPLLPARVRAFWQKLEPTGRVNVPVLNISRGTGGRAGFRIELQLDDVNMVIHPMDWTSSRERWIQSEPRAVITKLQQTSVPSLLMQAAVGAQPKVRTGSIHLDGVQGRFVFTEDGVNLDELSATIDGNTFDIRGNLGGYALDAPMTLTVASPVDRPIELRPSLPYINSLPQEIREVYYRFNPVGRSNVHVTLERQTAGERVNVNGSLEFANANFVFQQFRYPVKNASGRLVVDADPQTGEPRLVIDRIGGTGAADGPNAQGQLAVSGVITPLIGFSAVDVEVSGRNIRSEPPLIAALPPEARNVIAQFDDDGPGPNPTFQGDFLCRVRREPGAISRWSYDTDVHVIKGRGALKDFPFPLEDLSLDLLIRKDYVQIASARSTHAGGTIEITGLSEWGKRVTGDRPRRIGESNVRTSLTLKARDLPIDDALRNALPAEARAQLIRYGIGGTVDVTGPIVVGGESDEPSFDFTIVASDARFAPVDWKTSIEQLTATLQLTPHALKLDRAVGQRGTSRVTADGKIEWPRGGPTSFDIQMSAASLTLDEPLRDSLPPDARKIWNDLRPSGVADGVVHLVSVGDRLDWTIQGKPLDVTLDKPAFLPLPITKLNGALTATRSRIEFDRLTAAIAGGTANLTGVGEFSPERSSWALKLQTTDSQIDRTLFDALPKALGDTFIDNEVLGNADLKFERLDWTSSTGDPATAGAAPGATDIIFDVSAVFRDAAWRTGVSFDQAQGAAVLRGHFIDDEPADLAGDLTLKTFRIAGLPATDGTAAIHTDSTARQTRINDVRAKLADGDIAGKITLDRTRAKQTRWSGDFLLRNADVSQLTTGSGTKLNGRLNASLALEGGWGVNQNTIPRRGRGDISVTGKDMVNVPMVLGVTQVVSLALPFTGGFNEATASYSLDGDRVSFSEISLQSNEMKIKGAGSLDFEKKQVRLDFYTDSTGKKLPVIGNLLDAARRELFQIKVRGTLEEPTVKAGSLKTITTTVDEILNNPKE